MTKYPALYAALEPDDVNGRRGFTVRCTATRRAIGFIWWTCDSGTTVVWHFRTGDHSGQRTTERNAVQALRDISNGQGAFDLPPADDAVAPTRPAPQARRVFAMPASTEPEPEPVLRPAASRRIVWGEQLPNLTAAIAAAFEKGGKK
jgi:hypothetical protein